MLMAAFDWQGVTSY